MNSSKGIIGKIFVFLLKCVRTYYNVICKGYICSCKTGQRNLGCCVHVASAIIFFSSIVHNYEEFEAPADHFTSFLINIDENEQPNRPKFIKGKRKR